MVALTLGAPCAALGLGLAYTYWGWPATLGIGLLAVVALTVGTGKVASSTERGCWAVVLVLATVVFTAGMVTVVRDDLLLTFSGTTVTARVVEKERIPADRGYQFRHTLKTRDGSLVPGGQLTAHGERFRIGEEVTVRMDPRGRARPQLPEEIDIGSDVAWGVTGAAATVLAILYAGLTARPPGRARVRFHERSRTARRRVRQRGPLRLAAVLGVLSALWLLAFVLADAHVGGALTIPLGTGYLLAVVACVAWLPEKEDANFRLAIVLVAALFAGAGPFVAAKL
ncbi:hypothetical protein [Kitasatospora sp. NPDC090091]|uniref:hypothetical protein n=1 Tax=Kitasatospora sp. NPDC090091 TaxID=3364081 RepID=UPI0038279F25